MRSTSGAHQGHVVKQLHATVITKLLLVTIQGFMFVIVIHCKVTI